MAALSGVLGLVALFVGTHIGLATRPVRSRLVAACGEWGFLAIFFAVAATSFGVLTRFYAAHQFEGPAGPALGASPLLRPVLMGCVVAGVALMVASLAGYSGSPYDVGPSARMRPARGLERVTRHPFFTGVVLFGVAHALLATRLVGSVVMLALAVLAVAGAWHQDRKLAQRRGAPFAEYLASTSGMPFAAVAAGRQRLVWGELPIGAMVAGLAVAAGLRYEHDAIFAHGGAWVILAIVGGAAQITASAWRRDRRSRPRPDEPPPGETASDRPLARVQAISGLCFLGFVSLHLANLMLAARSPAAYNAFQRALRPFYQFPPLEIGLIAAPLLVHVVAGIRRLRRHRAPRDLRARLHRWSGVFLLVVIFGHVAATRGPSLVYGVYPEFEGLELSLWLAPYVFYPYYAVFACAAVYHAFNGAGVALGILGRPLPRLVRRGLGFWVPVTASAVVAVVAILGIGGWLYPLPDPRGTEVGRLAARLLGRSLPWSD